MFLQRGNLHAAVAEHVGEHHGWTAGVGDDGATLAFDFRMHEHAANGGEFLAVMATHDARFAEQGIDGGVVGGEGAGVRRGSTGTGG